MNEPDAIVVGSGPNGLAAAVTLTLGGLRVVVHEQAGRIGGAASTAELTLPGFLHDVGSAVHPMALASPFFSRLPLGRHGLSWVQPPLALAHPLDDGSAVIAERSLFATAAGLGADRGAYVRAMLPLVRRWNALVREVLAPPVHLPRAPWLLAALGARAIGGAQRLAERWFTGPRARALLAGVAAHANVPLDRVASAGVGLVLLSAAHAVGWPLPRGGAGRISAALAALVRAGGGEVRTGSPVHGLADLPPTRLVMADCSPRALAALAGERLPAGYRRRLERFRSGPGVFKVDWALDRPIPWTAPACRLAGTVHVGGGLEEIAAAERAAWDGRPCNRPFVILAQPTLFDPSRAPAGRHVAWAYCHVGHGSTEDATGAIEDQVERFAPGFRASILARRSWSPQALEADNPNLVGGDIGGGALTGAQLLLRPVASLVPWATPDPALYLCSASTPPGPAVHGLCGWYAARAALRRSGG